MTREAFIKRLKFIEDEIQYAYELFESYKKIYNKQMTDNDALNTIPGFFQMVLFSFLNASAMILSRIYDDDKNTLMLVKLRNNLEQSSKEMGIEKKAVEAELFKIDAYLAETASIVPKLKILRDKVLAHNDKRKAEENIWKVAGVTVGDYDKLIETAYNIVCICYVLLDCSVPLLGSGTDMEIDTLIAALNKWNIDDWEEIE